MEKITYKRSKIISGSISVLIFLFLFSAIALLFPNITLVFLLLIVVVGSVSFFFLWSKIILSFETEGFFYKGKLYIWKNIKQVNFIVSSISAKEFKKSMSEMQSQGLHRNTDIIANKISSSMILSLIHESPSGKVIDDGRIEIILVDKTVVRISLRSLSIQAYDLVPIIKKFTQTASFGETVDEKFILKKR